MRIFMVRRHLFRYRCRLFYSVFFSIQKGSGFAPVSCEPFNCFGLSIGLGTGVRRNSERVLLNPAFLSSLLKEPPCPATNTAPDTTRPFKAKRTQKPEKPRTHIRVSNPGPLQQKAFPAFALTTRPFNGGNYRVRRFAGIKRAFFSRVFSSGNVPPCFLFVSPRVGGLYPLSADFMLHAGGAPRPQSLTSPCSSP